MSKQLNVRLPKPTINRINQLANLYGSQSKVIIAAISELHTKEIEMPKKAIEFLVSDNLEYYGDSATNQDIEDYAKFAEKYLSNLGYDVAIERVEHYPMRNDEQWELREEVWVAYCHQ